MSANPPHNEFLSVIIPTFNEAARLPQSLNEILSFLDKNFSRYEVIVVDDNSPDGTGDITREFGKKHEQVRLTVQPGRLGKGAAVRRGCLEAKGELVLFMDADHATPISEITRFLEEIKIGTPSAVVGVRTYQEDESRGRRIIGLCAQLLAHVVVFKKAVVDSQCGFKLFTREAVQQIFPLARVDGGMLDVELFHLMHIQDVPCRYVPVVWKNKDGTRINIIACMMRDPIDMLKVRLRDWTGHYNRPLNETEQPWSQAAS